MRAEELEGFCYDLSRSAGYFGVKTPDLVLVSPKLMQDYRVLCAAKRQAPERVQYGIRIAADPTLDDEDYEVCRFMTAHNPGGGHTGWLSHDR